MPRWIALFILAALVFCTGCIAQSVHPLFDETDRWFDAGLIGTWTSKSGEDRWTFASEDQLNYNFTYTDENGRSANLLGRLVSLDGTGFLDVFPAEPSQDQNVLAALSMIPVHTLWRLDHTGDTLHLTPGDMKWLSEYLKAHPSELPFELAAEPQEKDWPVLTASTAQLRLFISQHKDDDGLFKTSTDDGLLTRVTQAQAAKTRRVKPAAAKAHHAH